MIQRKIIHIDMDAFYASVEQRDNPDLRGKPVAVGGSRERGVVAAASYEARKYGIHSAMPSSRAYRLCPDIIFVKPRFEHYSKVSRQIREVFFEYTDLVEPLSLDEAYLDVTENKQGIQSATAIAKAIRQQIKAKTQLTASAGISINKFLAKVASDIHKPDGLTLIPPENALAFLEKLPIRKFHGIGEKTAEKMKRLGIRTGADLKKRSEIELVKLFGKAGRHYFRIVRAEDERPVKPNRIRKSVGAENTFFEDIEREEDMKERLGKILIKVCQRLNKIPAGGKTITLKIKYSDFQIQTRSKTQGRFLSNFEDIYPIVMELLYQPEFPARPVRLLGISLSNLDLIEEKGGKQLTLEF